MTTYTVRLIDDTVGKIDSDDRALAGRHAEELIVRANLHDELVAALKDAHAYMPLGAQRARIGDVIAKVEGR